MKPLSPMGDRGQRMDRLEQPWKMRVLRTLINLLKVCTCLYLLLHVMIAIMLLAVDELHMHHLLLLNLTNSAMLYRVCGSRCSYHGGLQDQGVGD